MFHDHARDDVRCRAIRPDTDNFAFEIFHRFERRFSNQRQRRAILRAGDHFQLRAFEIGADHRADQRRVVDVAAHQRHGRDIRVHANDFGVDSLLFEKILRVRHTNRQVGNIVIGHADPDLVGA